MNDTILTMVGNVVDDPALKTTDSGRQVANFRLAATPRRRERSGEWVDDITTFMSIACWGELAVSVAASLKKGQPVIVTGRFRTREFTKDEQLRTTTELVADAVGHNLRWGLANFGKKPKAPGADAEFVGSLAVPDSPAELAATDPIDGDPVVTELVATGR